MRKPILSGQFTDPNLVSGDTPTSTVPSIQKSTVEVLVDCYVTTSDSQQPVPNF